VTEPIKQSTLERYSTN